LHVAEIFKLPLAIPFWVVFLFAFAGEERIIRGSFTDVPSAQDKGTFHALMIGSPLAMIAASVASYMHWLTIPYPIGAVVIGTIMLIAGAVLRRYCFNALGKSFTGRVTVLKDQANCSTRCIPTGSASFLHGCILEVHGSWTRVG